MSLERLMVGLAAECLFLAKTLIYLASCRLGARLYLSRRCLRFCLFSKFCCGPTGSNVWAAERQISYIRIFFGLEEESSLVTKFQLYTLVVMFPCNLADQSVPMSGQSQWVCNSVSFGRKYSKACMAFKSPSSAYSWLARQFGCINQQKVASRSEIIRSSAYSIKRYSTISEYDCSSLLDFLCQFCTDVTRGLS